MMMFCQIILEETRSFFTSGLKILEVSVPHVLLQNIIILEETRSFFTSGLKILDVSVPQVLLQNLIIRSKT